MTHSSRQPAARLVAAVVAAGLVLMLAACSQTTSASTTSTSSTSSTMLITTTTVHYVPRYVSVGGRDVLLPTEEHHEPITSYSDFGQNVIITKAGFEPWKLYALNKTPIVFTNLTDSAQEVVFYHFPNIAHSGTIPPGGSYSFSYNASIALVYGNRAGTNTGHLYIGGCPPTCG
jgi:ABC-type Fe3+-hydroxamate transport system substrate-binding protein